LDCLKSWEIITKSSGNRVNTRFFSFATFDNLSILDKEAEASHRLRDLFLVSTRRFSSRLLAYAQAPSDRIVELQARTCSALES
jgi:hypothetical protein